MRTVSAFDIHAVLACPRCRGPLPKELFCARCSVAYPVVDEIPLLFATGGEVNSLDDNLYDRIALEYDDTIPGHVADHYLKRRVSLISQEVRGGTLLDVCCGTGRLAAALETLRYTLVGIDASPGMLRVFRERQPNAVAVAGYAQRLPFQDASFDLVVSVAALHHIAKPDLVSAALMEMCRVAKPGGKILVWDHNKLNPYWPFLMSRVPQDSGDERLVPLAEVERGLRLAGCAHIESRRLGFTPDFVPRSALSTWRRLENLAEATPFLRKIAAHNVVVARKPLEES